MEKYLLLPLIVSLFLALCYVYHSSSSSSLNTAMLRPSRLLPAIPSDQPYPGSSKRSGVHKHYFHTFWLMGKGGPLNEKVVTAYRSVLRIHRNIRFIVWTLPRTKEATEQQIESLKTYCPTSSIEVKTTLDLIEMVKADGSALKMCEEALSLTYENFDLAAVSDLIRFVALYYYGGIYVDSDVLMVKSMAPFFNKDFAFRWDSGNARYNTCVMGLKKNSQLTTKVITHFNECKASTFHPEKVIDALSCPHRICEDFLMYPTHLFDPMQVDPDTPVKKAWQWMQPNPTGDRFEWFFKENRTTSLNAFFPGIYAYHWHNRWDADIHPESFFAEFQRLNAKCEL